MSRDTRAARIEAAFRAFEDARSHEREVVELLAHDDEAVRTAALETLAGYADDPGHVEPLLPAVVSRATDPEPAVRHAVQTVLHRLAEACVENDEPLPGLDALLTHADADVRRDALHGAKMAGERHPGVLAEHVSVLAGLLSDPDAEIRHVAALVLDVAAADRPDDVARITPSLVDRLEADDVLVKNAVVQTLATVSAHRPRVVVDTVPAIRTELDAGVVEREPVIETIANVAEAAPGSVIEFTPELVDAAAGPAAGGQQDGGGTLMEAARQNERRLRQAGARADALRALGSIAGHDPDAVAPRVEAVMPLLASDVPRVREATLALIRTLGIEHPRTMETTVPALLEHAGGAPTEAERALARGVLIDVGDADPPTFARSLERNVDQVVDLLSHDDAEVRASAAGLLSYVAEEDPTAVSTATGTLIELLDDDPIVRGSAALVLGLSGSDEARAALASLDPDEEFVEEAVERALERLE